MGVSIIIIRPLPYIIMGPPLPLPLNRLLIIDYCLLFARGPYYSMALLNYRHSLRFVSYQSFI
jgi:hypothetical protein